MATNPKTDRYRGIASFTKEGPRWSGALEFHPDVLDKPLRMRGSKRIFTCSMSDLFHEKLPGEKIAMVFSIMALVAQRKQPHTFQILTKRPEVASVLLGAPEFEERVKLLCSQSHEVAYEEAVRSEMNWQWPLPNVWLGTSVEDQETADTRIPTLLCGNAALHFVSYEPALGAVTFPTMSCIDWLIVGGESGPNHREASIDWFHYAHAQALEHGVPFFMKQDSGTGPGKRGRIPRDLFSVKEFPLPKEPYRARGRAGLCL